MSIFKRKNKKTDIITEADSVREEGYEPMDVIEFGRYPTGADGSVEPVKWIVLAKDGSRRLLITREIIDCIPFNNEHAIVSWDKCSLRKYMNNDMFNTLFSRDEKKRVVTTVNETEPNEKYSQDPPFSTKDKLFVFTIYEVSKYFPDQPSRCAKPTPYAEKKGVYPEPSEDYHGYWWLRTPSDRNYTYSTRVWWDGELSRIGTPAEDEEIGVRPAVWIDLSK